jgi:hypothetical protein
MTINWKVSLLEFILGTLTLWVCSYTVNTQSSDVKTAAIYNAIQQILSLIIFGIAFFIWTKPYTFSTIIVTFIIIFFVSFFLLKRMYGTSIFSTTWLVVACWAVRAGAEKLTRAIF